MLIHLLICFFPRESYTNGVKISKKGSLERKLKVQMTFFKWQTLHPIWIFCHSMAQNENFIPKGANKQSRDGSEVGNRFQIIKKLSFEISNLRNNSAMRWQVYS